MNPGVEGGAQGPPAGAGRSASSHVRLLWIIGSVWLFLLPELVGGRRLGGSWLEAWTYPVWHYIHERLMSGQLALWNPHIDCGLSLVGSPAVGLCYPLNWLVWMFKPSIAIPFCVGLHLVLAAAGACWLMSRLGCRDEAALVGGIALALGGVLPALAGTPERLEVFSWWPWLVLALEDERSLLAAAVVGLQGLAGDPQGVLISGVTAGVWVLVRHARHADITVLLSRVGGIGLLGLALGAAGWLPYAAVYRHSLRFHAPLVEASSHLSLGSWLPQLFPIFPLTALLLAGFARVHHPRTAQVIPAAWLLVLVSLVGARGLFGPLGWLSHALSSRPQVLFQLASDAVKSLAGDDPLRWLTAAGLSVALLAGLGLSRFFQRGQQVGWSLALLQLAVCIVIGRISLPVGHGPWGPDPDQLALLMPIAATGYRYTVAGAPDPRLYNAGCLVGARSAVGFTPMAPMDTMDLLSWAARARLVDVEDQQTLLRNGHHIDSNGFGDAILQTMCVRLALDTVSSQDALHLRSLDTAWNRLRLADRPQPFERSSTDADDADLDARRDMEERPSPEGLNPTMLAAMSHPHAADEVFLDQQPDLGDAPPVDQPPLVGQPTFIEDRPEHQIVDVDSSRKAMLVVSDAYDDGWLAQVNGEPHRVYVADAIMRAVVVPEGHSRVEWTYNPPTWAVGWRLSLAALVLCGVLEMRERRKPVRVPPVEPDQVPEAPVNPAETSDPPA